MKKHIVGKTTTVETGALVLWLSLPDNFIPQSLQNSCFPLVQILLVAFRGESLTMAPSGNKAKGLLTVSHSAKTNHHHSVPSQTSKTGRFCRNTLWVKFRLNFCRTKFSSLSQSFVSFNRRKCLLTVNIRHF